MSQDIPEYKTGAEKPSKQEFIRRPCNLPFTDPAFLQPTGQDLKDLKALSGWSQKEIADIVGASSSKKGSPMVRKWLSAEDSTEHRQIPNAAWRLLLMHSRLFDHEMLLNIKPYTVSFFNIEKIQADSARNALEVEYKVMADSHQRARQVGHELFHEENPDANIDDYTSNVSWCSDSID